MKHLIATILIVALSASEAFAQTHVTGSVSDGREPLIGVNVFILGTLDGSVTDSLGRFDFTTKRKGEVTLMASLIGFEEYTLAADASTLSGLRIVLKEKAATLDEVVVTASTYSIGKSHQIKTLDPIDVVLSGNSCGDVVSALQSLPGSQKVGEDGRLYVRGGDSEECQTFINGMHVLVPYLTHTPNNPVRGRFSPFLFKGMSFSLGGYGGEYGQALSSILPMETTDVASSDKLGLSISPLEWSIGGTKSFSKSSLSFNTSYTDLGLYNEVFPDRYDWTRPYRKASGEAQYKAELSSSSVLKSYVGYDYSSVGQNIDDRSLSLLEHNIYANATVRSDLGSGWSFFAGAANSTVFSDIDDALVAGDRYHNFRNEVHLKSEIKKNFSSILKVSAGLEDYLRASSMKYDSYESDIDYNLAGAHVTAQLRIVPRLFMNASVRLENLSSAKEWKVLPRMTLSYVPGGNFQASLMFGQYSQTPNDDCMLKSAGKLGQSTADHAILSTQWSNSKTLFRLEAYWKRYSRLPLLSDGKYVSDGYGKSRGFDLFFENSSLVDNLKVSVAYSYNDSKRRYMEYDTLRMPDYASRHNLNIGFKYFFKKYNVSLTDSYTSKRFSGGAWTPAYNSLDGNVTWLASPKVIVYASLSNLLGRENVFSFNSDGSAVTASRKRFFYLGIFISIKNKNAYDVSNF